MLTPSTAPAVQVQRRGVDAAAALGHRPQRPRASGSSLASPPASWLQHDSSNSNTLQLLQHHSPSPGRTPWPQSRGELAPQPRGTPPEEPPPQHDAQAPTPWLAQRHQQPSAAPPPPAHASQHHSRDAAVLSARICGARSSWGLRQLLQQCGGDLPPQLCLDVLRQLGRQRRAKQAGFMPHRTATSLSAWLDSRGLSQQQQQQQQQQQDEFELSEDDAEDWMLWPLHWTSPLPTTPASLRGEASGGGDDGTAPPAAQRRHEESPSGTEEVAGQVAALLLPRCRELDAGFLVEVAGALSALYTGAKGGGGATAGACSALIRAVAAGTRAALPALTLAQLTTLIQGLAHMQCQPGASWLAAFYGAFARRLMQAASGQDAAPQPPQLQQQHQQQQRVAPPAAAAAAPSTSPPERKAGGGRGSAPLPVVAKGTKLLNGLPPPPALLLPASTRHPPRHHSDHEQQQQQQQEEGAAQQDEGQHQPGGAPLNRPKRPAWAQKLQDMQSQQASPTPGQAHPSPAHTAAPPPPAPPARPPHDAANTWPAQQQAQPPSPSPALAHAQPTAPSSPALPSAARPTPPPTLWGVSHSIVVCLWSLQHLGCAPPQAWLQLVLQAADAQQRRAGAAPPARHLAWLLHTLARLRYRPPRAWLQQAVAASHAAMLRQLRADQAQHAQHGAGDGGPEAAPAFRDAVQALFFPAAAAAAGDGGTNAAQRAHHARARVQRRGAAAAAAAAELDLQQLLQLLWALVRLEVPLPPEWVAACKASVAPRVRRATARELALLLSSLALLHAAERREARWRRQAQGAAVPAAAPAAMRRPSSGATAPASRKPAGVAVAGGKAGRRRLVLVQRRTGGASAAAAAAVAGGTTVVAPDEVERLQQLTEERQRAAQYVHYALLQAALARVRASTSSCHTHDLPALVLLAFAALTA